MKSLNYVSFLAFSSFLPVVSYAAIDTTDALENLGSIAVGVAAIGGVVLAARALIKAYSMTSSAIR